MDNFFEPTINTCYWNGCRNKKQKPSGNFLRFRQTLQNRFEVFLGNDTYNLTKYDKKQKTHTTIL